MTEYYCIEIWKEEVGYYKKDKYFKKIHDDDHEKGGEEIELTEDEFNTLKKVLELKK